MGEFADSAGSPNQVSMSVTMPDSVTAGVAAAGVAVIAADIVDDAALATSAVGVTRAVSIVTNDNGAVAGAATVAVGGGSDGDVATAVAGFASATARVPVVVAVVAAGGALVFVLGGFVVATASIVFGDVSVGGSGTSGTGVIGVATAGLSVSCEVVDDDSALAES
jgi:hypothetical protein